MRDILNSGTVIKTKSLFDFFSFGLKYFESTLLLGDNIQLHIDRSKYLYGILR